MSDPSGPFEQTNASENGSVAQSSTNFPETSDAASHRGKADDEDDEAQSNKLDNTGMTPDPAIDTNEKHDTMDDTLEAMPAAASERNTDMVDTQPAQNIEEDTAEQLASGAATITLDDDTSNSHSNGGTTEVDVKEELPASPPPPAPPRKNSLPPKEESLEPAQSEKGTMSNIRTDMPQSTTEMTGQEIQNIMDQFGEGRDGPREEEIMSPLLERQQPFLVLPPRSSSLEPKNTYTISTTPGGTSIASPISPQGTGNTSMSPGGITRVTSNDQESIASGKTGSTFPPPPPTPDPEPVLPFDFHRFLEQLKHRTADPVARFLRSFLNEFGKKQWMVHEQVKIIADFLEFIAKKMAQCEVWRTVSDAEFDNAREGMEKLVMNRLYAQTFSPAITPVAGSPRKGKGGRSQADAASPHGPGRRGQHQEDVERDEVIAQKIRIYGWIQEEHLDINTIGEKGRKFLTLAQQELLKINSYRAPRDKVICVLNCCKVIFGFLKNSQGDQSADAFIPLLIYTVLRARPDHLVSNVQYIWRFRSQEKLGGEAGYYMSSLMGVVTFIENLDRTSLTISDEDFERNVEEAVSAIAEKNRTEEYEEKWHASAAAATPAAATATATGPLHRVSEKSAISRPEVTPRNSLEAESATPKHNASARLTEKTNSSTEEGEGDAVSGLLKTIQKPLSSIGRIFSDDGPSQQQQSSLKPAKIYQPASTPRALSPAPVLHRKLSGDGKTGGQRPDGERTRSQQRVSFEDAAARQASAETAEAQRVRAQEHKVVVE